MPSPATVAVVALAMITFSVVMSAVVSDQSRAYIYSAIDSSLETYESIAGYSYSDGEVLTVEMVNKGSRAVSLSIEGVSMRVLCLSPDGVDALSLSGDVADPYRSVALAPGGRSVLTIPLDTGVVWRSLSSAGSPISGCGRIIPVYVNVYAVSLETGSVYIFQSLPSGRAIVFGEEDLFKTVSKRLPDGSSSDFYVKLVTVCGFGPTDRRDASRFPTVIRVYEYLPNGTVLNEYSYRTGVASRSFDVECDLDGDQRFRIKIYRSDSGYIDIFYVYSYLWRSVAFSYTGLVLYSGYVDATVYSYRASAGTSTMSRGVMAVFPKALPEVDVPVEANTFTAYNLGDPSATAPKQFEYYSSVSLIGSYSSSTVRSILFCAFGLSFGLSWIIDRYCVSDTETDFSLPVVVYLS